MRCTRVDANVLEALERQNRTRFAVFRPTPGSANNSSIDAGTRPSNRETRMSQVALTCLAFDGRS